MMKYMNPILLLFLASSVVGQQTIRVCVPYEVDEAYLTNCTAMLQPVEGVISRVGFQCVEGGSSIKCMEKIRDGQADITAFDGGDVYTAFQLFGHIPLAAEQYSADLNGSYYAVAVVDKESCPLDLADLKAKNACHTGYRKTAGWFMPFGTLYSEELLDTSVASADDVNDDAELMADFFNEMCVPRTSSGPAFDAAGEAILYDPLCSICANGDCTTDSDYYDYSGAFRCLLEGTGDVAFVKHTTVTDYASDGNKPEDWGTRPSTDFQLLCRNGGCADITDFKDCNLANVPAHAIIGRSSFGSDGEDSQTGVNIVATLLDLAFYPEWLERVTELGGQSNFFLKSGTVDLVDVRTEFDTYMTPEAFANYQAVDLITSVSKPARFCNKNKGEMAKCQEVVANLNDLKLGIQFGCVETESDGDCLAAISAGEAEMKAFDVGDLSEGFELELDILVAENYGSDSGVEYYAIAVINSDDADTITSLPDLKGKRSCHTGYRKTAGWYMPVGALLQFGGMESVDQEESVQNDAESVAGYFSQVCAPRVTSSGPAFTFSGSVFDSEGEPTSWEPLCTGCAGDCTTEDPYYNYPGAFRCLMEGAGDVAFIKHTTIPQYALDGSGPEDWATKSSSDFKLLCPSGGTVDVDGYLDCSLARVPAHAVLIPQGLAYKDELQQALVKASQDPIFQNQVFGSNNPDDYLFKSSTVSLDPVMVDLETYLGEAFASLEAVEAVSK